MNDRVMEGKRVVEGVRASGRGKERERDVRVESGGDLKEWLRIYFEMF